MESCPKTEDERWSVLLKRMGVPKYPGVYIPGSFARHVTFYSQQVRALNLIDALCKTGKVAEGSSVAVVGAGLAGLTAAAAGLRRGLRIHLFEKQAHPGDSRGRMPLQTGSDERWIDPFIYDWPGEAGVPSDPDAGPSAELPVLSWSAAEASEVRNAVLKQFKDLVAALPQDPGQPLITFHEREVAARDLDRSGEDAWSVRIGDSGEKVVVDAVILAVGFGVEDQAQTRARYWTNDGLAGNQADGKTYLVTGTGDGGLTDVMRLCIAEFRHRDVLSAFRNATGAGSRLVEAVRSGRADLSRDFLAAAEEIDSPDTASLLKPRTTQVFLTGSSERLFGVEAGGSILNRLIVAWLLRKERFKLVDARAGIDDPAGPTFTSWNGDPLDRPEVLSFQHGELKPSGESLPQFDAVIVRHGPGTWDSATGNRWQPVREHFPDIWAKSGANIAWWKEMPHWNDWTRRPLWTHGDFADPPPPLDAPLRARQLYVVVENSGITRDFVSTAVDAVRRRASRHDPTAPQAELVRLDVRGSFATPHGFGRAVRMLCRADVVVFDVTPESAESELPPELMVLLGIRSVARRSLTVVTSRFVGARKPEPAPEDGPFEVPLLPFLLRDVSVYGWGREAPFIKLLEKIIGEGRARAKRLGALYRDLPAYEEVRRLGPEPADFRDQGPDETVLVLAPFDLDYRDRKGGWLIARVHDVAAGEPMYIAQSASPERISSKLYAAIRRVRLCIVDWTKRRPNVFFELGVRLAVTPKPPVCVIHRDDPWVGEFEGDEDACGLYGLFRPMAYHEAAGPGADAEFGAQLEARITALGQLDSASAWPLAGAKVSADFVFRQVEAASSPEGEDWSTPVWKELRSAAEQVLGPDPDRAPEFRGMFNDNESYRRQAQESALDRLLAAWYFLDQRYRIGERLKAGMLTVRWAEPPWSDWLEIGGILVREFKHDPRSDYKRVGKEIEEAVRIAESQTPGP